MSWKTFYMKALIWNILLAHVTWYTSAKSATMPIFDRVLYLDRVNSDLDKNLSAFWNEVQMWNLFDHYSKQGFVFSAVDEAFSTTTSKYQPALLNAKAEERLEEWHVSVIANHNHGFTKRFHQANPDTTWVYHFQTDVLWDKSVNFWYKIQEWHADSNAIPIARSMNFPEDLLNLIEMS